MTGLEILLLSVAAVFTSAMTVVGGSGGGTIIIALLLQFMGPSAAIPVHGVVHLVSNSWRAWLFRRYLVWPLIWRFALLLAPGTALGLWLFQGMSAETVLILIGCFILFTLFLRQLRVFREKDLALWSFIPIGFVIGVFTMIVGVLAPVLGVLMIRKDLTKESYVGTLGFFGVLTNLFKVVGFLFAGFSLLTYGPVILAMIPAVILGTWLGKHLLGKLSERLFMIVFKTILVVLALKLIFWDSGLLESV